MSSLTLPLPVRSSTVVGQIASCVEDLGLMAGGGCLVESAEGRLVAHHLSGTTPLLVTALVSGELHGLHRDLCDRRTTGLLPSGAVVEGQLGDQRAVLLSLRDQDQSVGAAWLLLASGQSIGLDVLRDPVQRLTDLLACTSPDVPVLAAILDGAPLPQELAGCERFWVARLVADLPAEALLRGLTRSAGAVALVPIRCGQHVYVVAAGARRVAAERALGAIRALCESASSRLGTVVTAGVSGTSATDGLVHARRQADLAVSAAPSGACVPLAAVRSELVARHLAGALSSLPDLGTDPLTTLADYDRRRNAGLVETLQTWLDACGDVARATEVLNVHSNTLRYRLRRIEEITGLDLRQDAAARLELQLRLLTLGAPA